MTFLVAWRLGLLLFVGAFVGLWLASLQRRQRDIVRFSDVALIDVVAPERSPWRRHIPAALWLLALSLLIVGFARPARDITIERESAVVVLAIDVSLSMESDDVEPSRLHAAQAAAVDFIEGLPSDVDIGLVLFSGTITPYSPVPEEDRGALVNTIQSATVDEYTAIGDAIGQGVTMIEDFHSNPDNEDLDSTEGASGPDADEDDGADSGADRLAGRIVLLGDGENTFGNDPVNAAGDAANAGIQVDTISFGTASGTIEQGGISQPVPVAPEQLQEISSNAAGDFYEADSLDELSAAYADVTAEYSQQETEQRDIGGWFTGAGLALLIGAGGLSLLWTQRLP